VTEVVVWALSAPAPERDQVTPLDVESLATAEVTVTTCPAMALCAEPGVKAMEMDGVPPPHPITRKHKANIGTAKI